MTAFDPSTPVELHITREIIDSSVRESETWCMVDRAIQLQISGALRPKTSVDGIRFTVGGKRYLAPPPEAVAKYIIAFDDGADIAPFRMVLSNIQTLAPQSKRRSQPRVADVRVSAEAVRSSPRTREYGRKILRANQTTIDDDLKQYDRIRERKAAS